MKKQLMRTLSVFLSILLLTPVFSGCSKNPSSEPSKPTAASSTAEKTDNSVNSVYPLKTNYKLRIWSQNKSFDISSTYGELPWAQEALKKTGIQVEWMHPSEDGVGSQLKLLLASGDLPDIMIYKWIAYQGGPQKLIDDGILTPLNDVIDKYSPNFKKYLETDPEIAKMIKTDSGKIFNYPMVRCAPGDFSSYIGPLVRKDWLDELGLKIPATIDDWYNMLKAFKDKKGAASPLALQDPFPIREVAFVGSYGIMYRFFKDNNKVKFGAIEPEYKDYLATMSKWYKEGLLAKDYGSIKEKQQSEKILSGESGASFGQQGAQMNTWNNSMAGKNPQFKIVPAPVPTALKSGNKPVIGYYTSRLGLYNPAITTSCKNVEVAARWCDYAYSKEGVINYNYGIEGVSYDMVNGKIKIKDINMWKTSPERYKYSFKSGFQSGYWDLVKETDAQLASPNDIDISPWQTDAPKYLMPDLPMSVEDAKKIDNIMSEIDDYINSMHVKFIKGEESIDTFDSYVRQVKKMGIDDALQIYQAALDKYNKK